MSDIEDLEEEINTLLDEIGSEAPTEEQEELLTELQEALEMAREEIVDRDDFQERRERLLDDNPAEIEGEIDSWEMLAQDSG
jgi:ElaB/YqjD/DUF883 family membrane-anchored ribosome-binding protein|tara:strand:+ start:688 stop:933 length:246 start_codon:yes stop_codon:yes gene_type:complete